MSIHASLSVCAFALITTLVQASRCKCCRLPIAPFGAVVIRLVFLSLAEWWKRELAVKIQRREKKKKENSRELLELMQG